MGLSECGRPRRVDRRWAVGEASADGTWVGSILISWSTCMKSIRTPTTGNKGQHKVRDILKEEEIFKKPKRQITYLPMPLRGDVEKRRTDPFQQHPGKKSRYFNKQILMLHRSGTEWRGKRS